MRDEMPELMLVPEVAAWLKIHTSSVYRMIKRKAIPYFRIGSDYRFDTQELRGWSERWGR